MKHVELSAVTIVSSERFGVNRIPRSFYFSLSRGAKYCCQRVCMSVCLSARPSQQEAQLLQKDRAKRYVSKFVLFHEA